MYCYFYYRFDNTRDFQLLENKRLAIWKNTRDYIRDYNYYNPEKIPKLKRRKSLNFFRVFSKEVRNSIPNVRPWSNSVFVIRDYPYYYVC